MLSLTSPRLRPLTCVHAKTMLGLLNVKLIYLCYSDLYVSCATLTYGAIDQGPISQRDLSPDLDLNLRLWS